MFSEEFKKKFKSPWWIAGSVAAVITAAIGVYTGAAAIGFDLDRPAWHSELIRLAGYALEPELERKRDELNAMESDIKKLLDRSEKPSKYLIRQRNKTREDIYNIQHILQKNGVGKEKNTIIN